MENTNQKQTQPTNDPPAQAPAHQHTCSLNQGGKLCFSGQNKGTQGPLPTGVKGQTSDGCDHVIRFISVSSLVVCSSALIKPRSRSLGSPAEVQASAGEASELQNKSDNVPKRIKRQRGVTLCRGSAARGRTGKVAGQGRRSVHAVSMATEDQEKKDTGGISEGDNGPSEEGTVVSVCVCVCFNSCQRDSG